MPQNNPPTPPHLINAPNFRAQHENGKTSLHTAKDARGLRLMRDSGYTHVTVNGAWTQIAVAIRNTEHAERMATLVQS